MKQRVRCVKGNTGGCDSKCRAVISDFDKLPNICLFTGTHQNWEKYEKLKVKKQDPVVKVTSKIFSFLDEFGV